MSDPFARKLGYHLSELEDSEKNHLSRTNARRSPPNRSPGRGSKGTVSPTNGAQEENSVTTSYTWRDSSVNPSKTPAEQPLSPSPIFGITGFRATAVGARSESELKQKIQALEDTVAEYERQKFNVMGTFAEYRERVAERERKLEAEYSTKIISLSEEVLGAKKDFEERMKSFQALQEKFEREKEGALELLRAEHQKEIQSLERRCSESQLMHLEQKYMVEIERLEEERKSLKSEKERLGEAFESKLRRAQSLYETELTAAKTLYSKELEALKDHEDALKQELFARQDEFRDRLSELQHQFKLGKDELDRCRKEVVELEQRLKVKEEEVANISQELHEARLESDECLHRLNKAESELDDTRQNYEQQKKELNKKIALLEKLELAKTHLESLCQDLQVEVRSLRSKVEFLQNERFNLESQSESQAQLQDSQVHALDAVLQNLSTERDNAKFQFENLLEVERVHAEEREYKLKKEFSGKLTDLEKQHKSLQENVDSKIQQERDMIRRKLSQDHDQRMKELMVENESLEEEIGSLRTRLHTALDTNSDTPIDYKLQQEIEARDKIIKDTKTHLNELRSKCEQQSKDAMELQQTIEQRDTAFAQLETDKTMAIEELKKQLDIAKSEWIIEKKIMQQDINSAKLTSKEVPVKDNDRIMKITIVTLNKTIDDLNVKIQKMEEEQTKSSEDEKTDQALELQKLSEEHLERIKALEDEIKQRGEEISNMNGENVIDRGEIERELRSKFAEAAAENHVADVEAFEKQLQVVKEQAEDREREQDERTNKLQKELISRESHIEKLHKKVVELTEQIETITKDLEERSNLLLNVDSDETESIDHEEIKKKHKQLAKDFISLNEKAKQAVKIGKTGEREAEANLKRRLSDKEAEIKKLQKELEKHRNCSNTKSNSNSPPGHEGCGRDHHQSRKPSISSTGSAPARHDLNIVNKWHSLLDQLKSDKSDSNNGSGKKLCRSEKERLENTEGSEASSSRSARSLSRLGAVSSSQTSLKPPESKRQGKSPTRPNFLSKLKTGTEKKPAWRF